MADKRNVDDIAKQVINQYMAEKQGKKAAADAAALESIRIKKNRLRTKAIVFAAVGCVITACLFYVSVAWYTRVSNTHAVTFDVADYELAVNDNTDNEFLVNVYDYSNVQEKTAAPGTAGYIPLKMSARHSEISVDYTINWSNLMFEELQKHIRFFYLEIGGKPVVCDLDKDGKTVIADHQKYFMSSPTDLPAGATKVYLDNDNKNKITGTVTMKTEKVIYIYWEWYLDAEDAEKHDVDVTRWEANWDALDTDIGRYPDKYHDSMFVKIHCVGVQSVPILETKNKSGN